MGMRRAALRLAIAAAVLLGSAAGVSYATDHTALQGSADMIQGCYAKSGTLRIVTGRARCRPTEHSISWSRRGGPQGPPGPAGEEGPEGEPGQDGEDGEDGADGADGADGEDGAPGQLSCDDEARIKAALPAFELSPSCSQGGDPGPCTDSPDVPDTRASATDLGSLAGDRSTTRLRAQGKICAGDSDWFRFDLREDRANKMQDLSGSVTLTTGSADGLDLCVYTNDETLIGCSRGGGDLQEILVHVVDDATKDDGAAFFVNVVATSPTGANDYELKVKGDVD